MTGTGWKMPGRYGNLVARDLPESSHLANEIRAAEQGIDFVKIINSGLNSLTIFAKETSPQFTPVELRGAFKAAREMGLQIMVHANSKKPVRQALAAGCHSIEHGFFMGKENLQRMADDQIVWVPTAVTMKANYDHSRKDSAQAAVSLKNLDHQLEQIRLAKDMGVPIAVGTDAGSPGVHHGAAIIEELDLMAQAGFSIEEAVGCSTRNGSGLLALHQNGVLAPGMTASFIGVKGGPEDLPQSLNAVAAVFVDGENLFHNPAP
jgi:imidazolonepropionase-like amidohydrolase